MEPDLTLWKSGNYRAYPFHRFVQSQYCEFLMDRKRYQEHRRRVAQVHAHIDVGRSKLKPIANSSQELSLSHFQVPSGKFNDVAELTIEVMDEITKLFGPNQSPLHSGCKPFSLNDAKNRQESHRIALDNRAIYHRLVSQKSCYPSKSWKEGWKLHQEYLTRISKFPKVRRSTESGEVTTKCSLPPIGRSKADIKTGKSDPLPHVPEFDPADCIMVQKSRLNKGPSSKCD